MVAILQTERQQNKTTRIPPIRKPGPRRKPTAPIRADESYDQHEFCDRVGWGRGALTQVRRDGLKAVLAGGRLMIVGRWFLEYLDRLAQGHPQESETRLTFSTRGGGE